MTISGILRTAGPYIGNNTTTVFGFTFKVFSTDQLVVVKLNTSTGVETTLTLITDYTVTLNGNQNSNPGGSITLPAVLATGYNLTLTSNVANLQPTDLTNQGGFYPEVITDALDRATIQIQQMSDDVTRSIKAPLSDDPLTMDMTLPVVADRINKILAFGATGMPTAVAQSPSSITGNTSIVGTLDVTGATTLASVGVTGAATVGTTLGVTGATTIQGLTVGKGGGTIASSTVLGFNALSANTSGIQNCAFGYNALSSNLSGNYSSAFGTNAMTSNTASNNNAFGVNALLLNTTGAQNCAFGTGALATNTTSNNNTAVGYQALSQNLASTNTAVGVNALQFNTTGANNTAVGYIALRDNLTGTHNIAIGNNALQLNTTGTGNIAIGVQALQANTGANNSAVGYLALINNTTGASNSAFGTSALSTNLSGSNMTAVGYNSLSANSTGGTCTAVGADALAVSTGASNTAIGYAAGSTLTTGATNVFVGRNAQPSAITISNEVNIYNGSVVARFQGAAAAWSFVSDARDKDNIENLSFGLDFIKQLQPRKFSWNIRNSDVDKGKESAGFIAQELASVVESQSANCLGLVYTNDPNQFSIAQTNLIPVLVNAIKELNAKFEAYVATHP